MRLKLRCFLICICLCAPFLSSAASDADSLLARADSLLQAGNAAQAAIAYEYVVYRATDSRMEARGCLGKAYAYKRMGRYEDALNNLSRVRFRPLGDTLHYLVRSEMAFLLFVSGRFAEAEQQFQQIDYFLPQLALKSESRYLRILTLNELQQWPEAKALALDWVADMNLSQHTKDSLQAEIALLYANPPKLKKRSKAETLSSIVPGLGHAYAGSVGEGTVSMLVSLAALGFTVYNVVQGNYITALTLGTGLLQMFLFGGVRRAGFLAERTNYDRTRGFNNPLKRTLVQWQRLWVE